MFDEFKWPFFWLGRNTNVHWKNKMWHFYLQLQKS